MNTTHILLGVGALAAIVIILMRKSSSEQLPPQQPNQQPLPGPMAPAVNPNIPGWAQGLVNIVTPLAQAGVQSYAVKAQTDLQRQQMGL